MQNNNRFVGHWYMGTARGLDCNLKLTPAGALTIRWRGCFHQDPEIASEWKLENSCLFLQHPTLVKRLGSYLRVSKQGKYTVLIPQNQETRVKREGFDYELCFWPNALEDHGLEIPKEASQWHEKRQKLLYPQRGK
jgi:hypothetical protein